MDDNFVPVLAAFLRTCSDPPRELLIAGNRFTNVAPLLCLPGLRLIDVSGACLIVSVCIVHIYVCACACVSGACRVHC